MVWSMSEYINYECVRRKAMKSSQLSKWYQEQNCWTVIIMVCSKYQWNSVQTGMGLFMGGCCEWNWDRMPSSYSVAGSDC